MYISNRKIIVFPYAIIIYVSLFALLITFTTKTMGSMIHQIHAAMNHQKETSIIQSNSKTSPAIVELFTSEGCSSCPPADKLLLKAQSSFNDKTIVLSYHVDYWDRLGWKDPYSKSIFSDRQRAYANHLNESTVYTPQIIVNGETSFVGSDQNALWNAINAHANSVGNAFIVNNMQVTANKIIIDYAYSNLQKNEELIFELVLKSATTQVKNGENKGATLVHTNIVREITIADNSKGMITIPVPLNFIKENYTIVAFKQNKTTLRIEGGLVIQIS
jgi:hypothetical protein